MARASGGYQPAGEGQGETDPGTGQPQRPATAVERRLPPVVITSSTSRTVRPPTGDQQPVGLMSGRSDKPANHGHAGDRNWQTSTGTEAGNVEQAGKPGGCIATGSKPQEKPGPESWPEARGQGRLLTLPSGISHVPGDQPPRVVRCT